MKNLIIILSIALLSSSLAFSNQNDIWSVGTSTTAGENIIRVDRDGNFIPGVDNRYDLGLSSRSWKNFHLDGEAQISSANISNLNASSVTFNRGSIQVTTGTIIVPSRSFIMLNSTGPITSPMVTLQNSPNVSTGTIPGGFFVIFTTTGPGTVRFQSEEVLANSGLHLGDSYRVLRSSVTLGLIYNDILDRWYEVFYSSTNSLNVQTF